MIKEIEGELDIELGEPLHRWEEDKHYVDLKTKSAVLSFLRICKECSNSKAYGRLEQLCDRAGMRIKAEADCNFLHILRRVGGKIIVGKEHYCFEYKLGIVLLLLNKQNDLDRKV